MQNFLVFILFYFKSVDNINIILRYLLLGAIGKVLNKEKVLLNYFNKS